MIALTTIVFVTSYFIVGATIYIHFSDSEEKRLLDEVLDNSLNSMTYILQSSLHLWAIFSLIEMVVLTAVVIIYVLFCK